MPLQLYKIASVEVGSAGASSINFASIPQGYTDLCLKLSGRGSRAAVFDYYQIKFNTSTTSFSGRYLFANGSTAASGTETNYAGTVSSATATASTFGNTEIYIPNYAGSTNKSYSVDSVTENNATTSEMAFYAGLWSNTSAINQVTIIAANGNLVANSTFTLYGIL